MIFTHLLLAAFSREPKGTAPILPDRIVVQFDPAPQTLLHAADAGD